jgi:Zn-dependent protease with chaperone function
VKTLQLLLLLSVSLATMQAQTPSSQATTPQASTPKTTTEYTLPPDKLIKAKAIYTVRTTLETFDPIYSFLVLLAILSFGVAAAYRNWAERISRWRFVQAWVFVPLLFLTLAVVDLPLSIYGHHISLKYGLSIQGWGSWFLDLLKGEAVSIAIFTPLLWLMMLIIRKSPRRWWFYFWLIGLPVIWFLVFAAPVIFDPLFNKFEPLEKSHPDLVQQIERVAARAHFVIPPDRLFEMKASEKVTTVNAYVTGLGASKRVVIWDTVINKMTVPEATFVVGHEMGHYVLNHITHGIILAAISLLIGFYFVYHVSGWFVARFHTRWFIRELSDWAALPMIFLLIGVLGFVAMPLLNGYSRHLEHQADIYGLEVTHGINPNSQEVAAHAFQVLGEVSLDYPYPNKLAVIWFWNHPAIADRVRFAHEYDPWGKGESPKYVK